VTISVTADSFFAAQKMAGQQDPHQLFCAARSRPISGQK
jgi:hypothetical protein